MVENAAGTIDWRLCHTLCQLYDAGSLVDFLTSLKTWLDGHPSDVVTLLLVNSDNANATTLAQQFLSASISSYGYIPPEITQPIASWPTLQQMISSNKRLVTFIASLDPITNTVAPYLLDEFTFIFENAYDNDSPQQFSCTVNRPSSLSGDTSVAISSGRMPLLNHFLYDLLNGGIEIPAVENISTTNAASGATGNLGAAASACSAVYGKAPTFILVDFVNVGPAIDTVDRLNGVQGQTQGRTALPTGTLPASSSSSLTSSSAAVSSAAVVGAGGGMLSASSITTSPHDILSTAVSTAPVHSSSLGSTFTALAAPSISMSSSTAAQASDASKGTVNSTPTASASSHSNLAVGRPSRMLNIFKLLCTATLICVCQALCWDNLFI